MARTRPTGLDPTDLDFLLDDDDLEDLSEEKLLEIFEAAGLPEVMGLPSGEMVSMQGIKDVIRKHAAEIPSMTPEKFSALIMNELSQTTPGSQRGKLAAAATLPWPVASGFRPQNEPFTNILDAEFNATGLRELAKFYDIKLKGSLKSALLEQVATGITERLAQTQTDPKAVLTGLTDAQALLLRKLFTAWDPELPFPRGMVKSLMQTADEKQVTELLEWMRKHAILFPARTYSYYISLRDAYYQLLPVGSLAPYLPGIVWPPDLWSGSTSDMRVEQPASLPLLEAVDRWLDAAHTGAVVLRTPSPAHDRAAQTNWLQRWEHDAGEAGRVFASRPGWVPDSRSSISVPQVPPLTPDSAQVLEGQTGLSADQCHWMLPLIGALQLIEPPARDRVSRTVNVANIGFETWLATPAEHRLRRVWVAWLEQVPEGVEIVLAGRRSVGGSAQAFKVLRAIGAHDFTPQQLAAEWCGLRRYLTRVLRGLPPHTWISWPLLRTQLFGLRPLCAHTLKTTDDWWFGRADGARLMDVKQDDWNRSTGLILETMIQTSLVWFGAVVCALASDGSLGRLMITETGRWLLTNQDSPLPPGSVPRARADEPPSWVGDLTWRVPPSPNRIEFIALSRKLGEPADQPFSYRLTTHSIEFALAQGLSMDLVQAQFDHAGIPLTTAARGLINELAGHFGRLRVYEGLTTLELTDELALRELLASTSLSQAVIAQLSPRSIVIRDDAVDALVAEMIARGHTPKVEEPTS